ncbi:hypothetical protein DPMN_113984 [Dreissena polymorpha]|uniref:Sushi domain-containing protein n=1 Tax=Dreissena polymorpha TaxID=45954 RepID=A0A9D4KJA4_DREPO|nr:hypothetical protein DPMN_113984 [Dreissena polymorpha]
MAVTNNGSNSVAHFACDHGYHLHGNVTLTCTSTGTWDAEVPVCLCDPPVSPANGNVVVASDGLSADYTCQAGFSLSGESHVTCGRDSTGWSDVALTCVTCGSPPSFTNGSATIATNGVISSLEFTCKLGTSLKGQAEVTCRQNGTWETTFPECGMFEFTFWLCMPNYLERH